MKLSELAKDLKPYLLPWISDAAARGAVQSASLVAHDLDGPYHAGSLNRTQAPWVATDINTALANHVAATDPHPAYVLAAGDTMTGPLLAPNGSASAPAWAFSGDPDNGLYWAAANVLGVSGALQAGWIKNSLLGFGGQGANDLSMLGFYDRNELTNADLRGTVTISITGAGSVTTSSVNNAFNARGSFLSITGTDATTTQIVVHIDLGATQPNYSSANWQPFLQYRLTMNGQATHYRTIVCEVSADNSTWHKPSSGQWETTSAHADELVPGLWLGKNGNPGIASWRYVRFTLSSRFEDPAYASKANIWIAQIGLRHYAAPYTRAWLHASGDTAYGPLGVRADNSAALNVATKAGTSIFAINTSAAQAMVNGDLDVLDTLTAANAAVGTAYDPTATLKVQSQFNDDITLFLKQKSGQTARMWRVEDSAGQELIVLDSQGNLQSGNPGFVSGLTGWQITPVGNAELNNAFIRGELHASIFVMDEFHASGGTLYVAPAGKLENDAVVSVTTGIEAVFDIRTTSVSGSGSQFDIRTTSASGSGSQFTLRTIENYIELTDPPSGHAMILSPGDRIRCKALGLSVGIDLWDVWGIVTRVEDWTTYYRYYYERKSGGTNGLLIPAGTAIISYGPPGAGRIYLTADQNYAPYMQVFLSGEEPWNGQITPTVRIGRLDGVGLPGVSGIEQHGIVLSSNLSNASAPYLVASNLKMFQYKIDSEWNNGNPTARITANGEFRLGTDVDADATTGLKFNPATGALDIGNASYPGAVKVRGIITVTGGSGIASFSDANLDNIANGATFGRINNTIIGGGFIRVGSGNKDSTLSGWYIDAGEIVGQWGGADQVVLDTAGRITAGGSTLDAAGLTMLTDTTDVHSSQLNARAVSFARGGMAPFGRMTSFYLAATATYGVDIYGRSPASEKVFARFGAEQASALYGGGAAGAPRVVAYSDAAGAGDFLRLYANTEIGLYRSGSATPDLALNTGGIVANNDLDMNGYNIIDANNTWAVRSTAPL
ncbi:MAG: hypothetical protein DYG89_15255 [Caldilinea sp. CFX5]|nr:hypothetical protein [Caldilinea sp. CFX5]